MTITWFGFCLACIYIFAIFIWIFWKSFEMFYDGNILKDSDENIVAWKLIPPGWWLLPLVPFWGKRWLARILEQATHVQSLELPYENLTKRKVDEEDEELELTGGACILISEYYDRGSGLEYGMRLKVIKRDSVFISRFGKNTKFGSNEIPVYTARPLKREWAFLEKAGDTFKINPRKREYIITVFNDEVQPKLCDYTKYHKLRSRNRFAIDITEYEFLKLPYLALYRKNGDLICKNIETKQKTYLKPFGLTIKDGKLIKAEKPFEHSTLHGIKNSYGPFSNDLISINPGDSLELLNERGKLLCGYKKVDD